MVLRVPKHAARSIAPQNRRHGSMEPKRLRAPPADGLTRSLAACNASIAARLKLASHIRVAEWLSGTSRERRAAQTHRWPSEEAGLASSALPKTAL